MKNITIYLYAIFLLLFSFFSYAFIDPNLSYLKNIYSGFAFSNKLLTVIFYILFVFIYFIFYGFFLWSWVKKRLNVKDIFLLIGLTVGILLFSYPAMLSYDIFNYILTAKVTFFYHENPYIVMPIEFTGEPFLSFTRAANKLALYGPLWILLTGIPYFLGLGNFIIILLNFKLLAGVFYLLTLFVVYKLSKNILPVIIFGLNPLVILETLVSSHNDMVMMFLVLSSLLLLKNKKVLFGISLFSMSILIKYASLILLPIFIFIVTYTLIKKKINWEKIYYFSALLMMLVFLLSFIREEIYPWYAIWFLAFVSIISESRKEFFYVSLTFSFSLLLRYIPFMLLGTYGNPTPIIKIFLTFIPISIMLMYVFLRSKVWLKIFFL